MNGSNRHLKFCFSNIGPKFIELNSFLKIGFCVDMGLGVDMDPLSNKLNSNKSDCL